MATTAEVQVATAQTAALIAREPSVVVFRRPRANEGDGAGGYVEDDATDDLEPQTLFISGVAKDAGAMGAFVSDEDGERLANHLIIIGMPDADIKKGDEFTFRGRDLRVRFVHEDRRWQTKAECDRVVSGNG
jgi:hypothetical protein